MGACDFMVSAKRMGKRDKLVKGEDGVLRQGYVEYRTPDEAFVDLVDDDRYENGHEYSGGIGMKNEFKIAGVAKTHKDALALANDFLRADDRRYCDKWGPCGCISILNDDEDVKYVFFGFAAS